LKAWLRNRVARRRTRAATRREFQLDRRRFDEYGCPSRQFQNPESMLAFIRMLEHSLEKGLSLPEPRAGFGRAKAIQLCDYVAAYCKQFGWTNTLNSAVVALIEYAKYNRERGCVCEEVELRTENLERFRTCDGETLKCDAGAVSVTRDSFLAAAKRDLSEFFKSRRSIRSFSREPVSLDAISAAVRMAQKTPSVCNRQSARVYAFDNDIRGQAVLACQAGNSGFGHTANKILIVTSDLRCFLSVGERNQCWIDGGMFAMSLIYALHSLGLGTCCLNWSVEHAADRRLRAAASIPEYENIIMLIAVGHIPDRLLVAASSRHPLNEVLRIRCGIEEGSEARTTQCDRRDANLVSTACSF